MVVAHLTDWLAHFIASEVALLENESERIEAVQFKLSVDRDIQMARCKQTAFKCLPLLSTQDLHVYWWIWFT